MEKLPVCFTGSVWIAAPWNGTPYSSAQVPCLRREFDLPGEIASARLAITAFGVYDTTINGVAVGNEVFAPGWTDYRQRVAYLEHDVSALLSPGANVIGVLLGDGWYCGHIAWLGRQLYGDRPWLRARLVVELRDGQTIAIGTGAEWRAWFSPIAQSDMLMGEIHDARNEPHGWNKPGFDDSGWLPVLTGDPHPESILQQRVAPPVCRRGEIEPVEISTRPDERGGLRKILDFGVNLVGRVKLTVKAPRGTTVRLRFAEVLDQQGELYTDNLRSALATDYYTTGSDRAETWEPKFTFHGFRYVEVNSLCADAEVSAAAIVLHSDMAETGNFDCSHPLINRLQSNIVQGQKGNFIDIPTDCPQRDERLGWTGDAQVFIATAAFNMDVRTFFHKWMQDVRDAQSPAGGIPPVCPSPGPRLLSMEDGGPAWADAVILCPWAVYVAYGDRQILADNYEAMHRYMDFLARHRCLGHIRSHPDVDPWGGFGDWLALDGSGQLEGATPKDLIGTAFYARNADLLARIARVLGYSGDAAAYASLHREILQAFRKRFMDETSGLLRCPTQTAYALTLRFGLAPEERKAALAGELVRRISENGFHIGTGFVGTPHILHVLSDHGHLDTAYRLLEQEAFPSWLFPVKHGATTIWERWNGWTPHDGFADKSMNSFNHYAYGAVGEWMYTTVAGLNPDPEEPGYRHIIFRPRPGGTLTRASASLDTAYGRVAIRWERSGDSLHIGLEVPPGTHATLNPPVGSDPVTVQPGSHAMEFELAAPENQRTGQILAAPLTTLP